MNRWIVFGLILAAGPALGQKVYKCPGPDGKAVYQQQRCPEGERMIVRDNGSGSGADADSALRSGEKQALDGIRQQEAAAKQKANQQTAQPPAASPYARSPAHDGLERIIRESDATIRSLNQLKRR
jgi:hypothetical protein